jgi:hypothetical protein
VLSPDKKSLIFINKKDLSLWLLELQWDSQLTVRE